MKTIHIIGINILTIITLSNGNPPKVYEEDQLDIKPAESVTRTMRDPNNHPKHFYETPPPFNYQAALKQQDLRSNKYAQQQLFDLRNIVQRNKYFNNNRTDTQYWKVVDNKQIKNSRPTYSSVYSLIKDDLNRNQSRVSRKLKPGSYYENIENSNLQHNYEVIEDELKLNRQDDNKNGNSFIYIPENDGHLSSLVITQQDELKHLDGNKDKSKKINNNNNGNLPQNNLLQTLQAKFDAIARYQTEEALAHAQKQAIAHVETQHKAIAKAQIEAQNIIIKQLTNQKASTLEYDENSKLHVNPVLIPLKDEVVPSVIKYQNLNDKILETANQEVKVHPNLKENLNIHEQYAARYAFGYRIKDYKMGNDFGHEEKRNGKNAKGQYHVLLPDGRMQKVDYFADNSGYHAKKLWKN